jgi:hypothetical protein
MKKKKKTKQKKKKKKNLVSHLALQPHISTHHLPLLLRHLLTTVELLWHRLPLPYLCNHRPFVCVGPPQATLKDAIEGGQTTQTLCIQKVSSRDWFVNPINCFGMINHSHNG